MRMGMGMGMGMGRGWGTGDGEVGQEARALQSCLGRAVAFESKPKRFTRCSAMVYDRLR